MTTLDSKYDRQVRLFGEDVQNKLQGMEIQILGPSNFASLEIVKNIVLLGVGSIVISESISLGIETIIPDGLKGINENLNIRIAGKTIGSDFTFYVDTIENKQSIESHIITASSKCLQQNTRFYSVCTKCKTISLNKTEHDCQTSATTDADLFLLGALVVQEFLKILQNKNYIHHLTLNI